MKTIKFKDYLKFKNIYAYLQGNFRYWIYYKCPILKFIVPNHIWEQIEVRIKSITAECYNQGFCRHCSCTVTQLQFANKPCGEPCYPVMVDRFWWTFIKNHNLYWCNETKTMWKLSCGRFIKVG